MNGAVGESELGRGTVYDFIAWPTSVIFELRVKVLFANGENERVPESWIFQTCD